MISRHAVGLYCAFSFELKKLDAAARCGTHAPAHTALPAFGAVEGLRYSPQFFATSTWIFTGPLPMRDVPLSPPPQDLLSASEGHKPAAYFYVTVPLGRMFSTNPPLRAWHSGFQPGCFRHRVFQINRMLQLKPGGSVPLCYQTPARKDGEG